MRKNLIFSGMLILALILLANPLYLQDPFIDRSIGFYIGPLFHAALSGLGFMVLFGAIASLWSISNRMNIEMAVTSIGILGVIGYVAFVWLITGPGGLSETRILGWGHRKTYIVSVVAALFVTGTAISARRSSVLWGVPVVLIIGMAFFAMDQIRGYRLITDIFGIVFNGFVVLGIPVIGLFLLAFGGIFGGIWAHFEYSKKAVHETHKIDG